MWETPMLRWIWYAFILTFCCCKPLRKLIKNLRIQHLICRNPTRLLLCELHTYLVMLFCPAFPYSIYLLFIWITVFRYIGLWKTFIVLYLWICFSVKCGFNLEDYSLSQCTLDRVSQPAWLCILQKERVFSISFRRTTHSLVIVGLLYLLPRYF